MTNDEQNIQNEAQYQAVDTKLDYIITKVDRVDESIHGNGQPGLKVIVAKHGQTLAVFRKVLWGVLGIMGSIAGGLALAAIL